MGLKADLMEAHKQGLIASGGTEETISLEPGSPIDVQASLQVDAIKNFLLAAEFRVTKLNAPVVMENFKIPKQAVDMKQETLLGEYGPLLTTLKKIANLVPGAGKLIDTLEQEIIRAIQPLLAEGANLRELDLNKDNSGLDGTGYVHVGADPDTQDAFDVDDESGQREFTTVKLLEEDIQDLL